MILNKPVKDFLVFLIIGLHTQLIRSELFYIEVKYPLLENSTADGNKSSIEPLVLRGSPWPMPQQMNGTTKTLLYLVNSDFLIKTNMQIVCDIIEENIKFYTNVLFASTAEDPQLSPTDLRATELSIEIGVSDHCPSYPNSTMDESYEIFVSTPVSKIKANSVWGALRGIETFSQLTFVTEDRKLVMYNGTYIKDAPRFPYRGVLIDTARHFIPIPILKKQIDAMAYNKFNVFHWHIVDDQSFPFESLKHPNLTIKGRYTKAHVYKQSDIKDLINHARLRGVRVIPEFDTPGHVESFGRTFPQFITVCWNEGKPYQSIFSVQGKAEILNPTIDELYPVLKDVISEFKEVFPDEYIHLGNDEVYYDCWKSNPNITEWMKNMNMTEYHELEAYYSSKLLKIAGDLNKKVTIWQDVYDNGVKLDKSAQIQIWKDTKTLAYHSSWSDYLSNITKSGYSAILSSPWYINFVSYGYQEWYNYYNVEPLQNYSGTPEQAKLLIGGETCLWSEYVDGTNIASRLWPRASAIAERLWSPAHVNDPEEAKFRLDEHRCRMLRRGIPATPVLNGFCGDYEYGMEKSVVYERVFNYGWPNSDTRSITISKNYLLTNLFVIIMSVFYFRYL